MRNNKGSRKIVVDEVEYRWRARGDDSYINIGIWPANNIGSYIQGYFQYHETWTDNGSGNKISNGDQIIITNKIIRRVIEHVISGHNYDPLLKGKTLRLGILDNVIEWRDGERATL